MGDVSFAAAFITATLSAPAPTHFQFTVARRNFRRIAHHQQLTSPIAAPICRKPCLASVLLACPEKAAPPFPLHWFSLNGPAHLLTRIVGKCSIDVPSAAHPANIRAVSLRPVIMEALSPKSFQGSSLVTGFSSYRFGKSQRPRRKHEAAFLPADMPRSEQAGRLAAFLLSVFLDFDASGNHEINAASWRNHLAGSKPRFSKHILAACVMDFFFGIRRADAHGFSTPSPAQIPSPRICSRLSPVMFFIVSRAPNQGKELNPRSFLLHHRVFLRYDDRRFFCLVDALTRIF